MNKFGESENKLGMKLNFCGLFSLCYCSHFRFCAYRAILPFQMKLRGREHLEGTIYLTHLRPLL